MKPSIRPEDFLPYIHAYPDFPKPGVLFRDIFPLIGNPKVFRQAIQAMAEISTRFRPTKILSIEARGFIVGSVLSLEMDVGMLPARKRGKLPGETITYQYDLEYGSDALQIPKGSIQKGDRVLIADDVLATGGTARAAMELTKLAGGEPVGLIAIIELSFLKGKEHLQKFGLETASLLHFDS